MWGKKGRASPTHESGGGMSHSAGGGGGGGSAGGEGGPTLRRSGTVTGQLTYSNKDKSAQHDPQILNTQLQSVQMQLQEKHNELNYYKSHCDELEKEVARLKLQLSLKDQEVEDLSARLGTPPPLRSRTFSALPPAATSTAATSPATVGRSATVSGDDASAAAAHIRGSGRASKMAPWVVGIGSNRMLRKDSGSPPQPSPLSGAQAPSSSQHAADAGSPPPNPLRSSGGMRHLLESEGVVASGVGINERHRLSAEILHGSPKEERRRLSIMATLAAAGEASKDYDTYRCDRENVTTLNALEAEVHALEAEVKMLERVASGDSISLESDSDVAAAAMSASSPDIGALIQRKITSSAPIPTRIKQRASLGEARSVRTHSDVDRAQASGRTQEAFGGQGSRSNHKRDDEAEDKEECDNDDKPGEVEGEERAQVSEQRRQGLSKRSLSADYANDATSNGPVEGNAQTAMANGDGGGDDANAGGTVEQDEEEDGDEDEEENENDGGEQGEKVPSSRRSWVKAGSPGWGRKAPEGAAESKSAKRRSLSDLRLTKEEHRRGYSAKVVVPLVAQCEGFTVECEYDYTIKTDTNYYSFLHQNWYREHYANQEHTCFIGVDTPLGTVIAAVKREKDPTVADLNNYQYSIMVLTQDGDQKAVVSASALGIAAATPGWAHKVVEASFPLLLTTGCLKQIDHPQLPQAVVSLEEKERPRKFKFGVVLVQSGQDSEEHFFSNQQGSADYDMFLQLLGNRVRLHGWDKFAGGLNVRSDVTGTESIYTEWRENQIMYHVSTLLPYTPDDTQQIERKRHIGNDIVLIVFLDDKTASYCPSLIKSHFIHVVVLVRVEKRDENGSVTHVRVAVTAKDGVPLFGPTLPKPAVFSVTEPRIFRDFFLSKLINAELAAYRTASFSRKLRVARRAMLDDISLKYWT